MMRTVARPRKKGDAERVVEGIAGPRLAHWTCFDLVKRLDERGEEVSKSLAMKQRRARREEA